MLRPEHAIFRTPFAVEPLLEDTPSPDNFAKWKPGFAPSLPTFAIFAAHDEHGEPGLVTSDAGFEEFPDAERILGGINMKGPDYAAVARHGSFVMWGFHSLPGELTDAGRRLYLNALAYAVAHKGKPVETLRVRPTRVDLEHAFTIFFDLYEETERLDMLRRHYVGEELPAELLTDAALRARWIAERLPFVHPVDDGSNWETSYQLTVDADCKTLGVGNGVPAFLDALAARLARDADDALAATLIARYVPDATPSTLATWLAANRERAYFTEAGGWTWRVEGRPARSPALRVVGASADDPVSVKAEVTASTMTITLRIKAGWHVYAPGANDGKPVRFRIVEGSAFETAGEADYGADDDGKLARFATIRVPIRRVAEGDTFAVDFTYTACDPKACRPEKTVRLER